MINNLPLPELNEDQKRPFVDLVDRILKIRCSADYYESADKQAGVKKLERQIDWIVYELYGLTPEEIGVVEGEGLHS